jgi:hypothetical protein
VVAKQIVKVVLVGLLSIGVPGVSNACRLLDSHAVPAFGERGCKDGCMKFIRQFFGTEERHVLLAERARPGQSACLRSLLHYDTILTHRSKIGTPPLLLPWAMLFPSAARAPAQKRILRRARLSTDLTRWALILTCRPTSAYGNGIPFLSEVGACPSW